MITNTYNQEGIHTETFHLLFKEEDIESKISDLPSQALYEIDSYTYNCFLYQSLVSTCIQYPISHFLADKIPRFHIGRPITFPHIHKKMGNGYLYRSKEIKFSFDLLECHLKKIVSDCGYLHDLRINLAFGQNISHCEESIILNQYLPNSFLVTGMIPMKNGDYIRHYIIELNYHNQDYVIDYASNLIIKKEDYYYLSKFNEIARIGHEELKNLYHFCATNHFCNHTAIIGIFGDEIYNDLEKNKIITKWKENDIKSCGIHF